MPRIATLILAVTMASTLNPALAYAAEPDGITVIKAWARATPGGTTVGAAYAVIRNDGTATDRLIKLQSPAAGRVELHTHTKEDGVMRMRRLDSTEIAAGQTLSMAPGGDHIMLFDLAAPLQAGSVLPLTLTFDKAGEVSLEAAIMPIGSAGPDAPGGAGSGSGSGSGAGSGSVSGSGEGSGSGSDSGSGSGSEVNP